MAHQSKTSKKVLFHEELVVVTRKDHEFAQRPDAFDEIAYADIPHLIYSDFGIVEENLDLAMRKRGLARRAAVSVPFYPSAPGILLSTDCVLTVGRALGEELCKVGGLVLLEPPIKVPGFDVSMLWAARNTSSITHTWLRELCAETAYASEQRSTSAAVLD